MTHTGHVELTDLPLMTGASEPQRLLGPSPRQFLIASRCRCLPAGYGRCGLYSGRRRLRLLPIFRPVTQENQNGTSYKDRRIRSYQDADHQGEGETIQHFTTKDPQRGGSQERKSGRQDGPALRLVDTGVHQSFEILIPGGPKVLADTIEHHNGVVHRIADERQERRDHGQ